MAAATASLLRALALLVSLLAGTFAFPSSAPAKTGAVKGGVAHVSVTGPRLSELEAGDLLGEDPEDAEETCGDGTNGAGGCEGRREETAALLKQLATLERKAAEQDTALAMLRQSVGELRQLRAEQDAVAAKCTSRCSHCEA